MSDRRVLRLGHVEANGRGVSFAPVAEAVFDVEEGEEIEFAVTYDFEEASRRKERFRMRLHVEADGRDLGWVEADVKDTPGVEDAERGALARRGRFGRAGLITGRFHVEADFTEAEWAGEKEISRGSVRESGRFLVRVH